MRRLLLTLLGLLCLGLSPAWAQSVLAPGNTAIVCAFNTSPPAISTGGFVFAQCDANGKLITSPTGSVTIGPYAYTPLTPGQHNLAIVASTALTVPTGATYATIQAATAQVKYTTDGTTAPTSTVGMTLPAGSGVILSGATVLANFRAISATGTLDVEYFK